MRYTGDQFFLKTAEQMAAVFQDHPDALRNTLLIAERCNVTIPTGQNHLPTFGVPNGFTLDTYFENYHLPSLHRKTVAPLIRGEPAWEAVAVAKRFADGRASPAELKRAHLAATSPVAAATALPEAWAAVWETMHQTNLRLAAGEAS